LNDVLKWLSEPWWSGVQGVVSVIGILAIVIAAADFIIRLNADGPDAMSFEVEREGADLRGDREIVTVTVTARPMGDHVLYEPAWRVWGKQMTPAELPPRLDVMSDPVSLVLYVHRDELKDVRVGMQWVVPRRYHPYAAAARCTVERGGVYERWRPYRWRRWPRHTNGRWVAGKDASPRNLLNRPD
jgi:hypothetical protein